MALDISRIGGLSAVGLLADKLLVEVDRMSKGYENVNKRVFQQASDYLTCAIQGLENINTLNISQNTVFAVNAYQTISSALPEPTCEDIKDFQIIIEKAKALCDEIANGINKDDRELKELVLLFESLSEYTTEERITALAACANRTRSLVDHYAH